MNNVINDTFDRLEPSEKLVFQKTWDEYVAEHKLTKDNPLYDLDNLKCAFKAFFINGVSARSNLLVSR